MKTWTPFLLSLLIALLINLYPWFMSFVVRADGWVEAGWAEFFITVPLGAIIVFVGLLVSLSLRIWRG